jgi:hypothetical protein
MDEEERVENLNPQNYLTVEPPLSEALPDPATLPGLALLGTLNLPMKLAKGTTAAVLDADLAPHRFGHRFRDNYGKANHGDAKSRLNLHNLIAKNGGTGADHDEAKFMTLRSVYRPGDPPRRKDVPIRVIVIDTAGKLPPVDIAVTVAR